MNLGYILKIKYYVFYIKLCLSMSSNAQQLFKLATDNSTSNCGSFVFEKRPKAHTIILDTLETNWSLNNCLKSLADDAVRIVFSGDHILDRESKTKLNFFLYNNPNIVIFTRNLSDTIFGNAVANVLFQSHWSPVNMVVVENKTFACKNSYFKQEVNASIRTFLSKMWKRYQIVQVVVEYPGACPNKFSTYDGTKKPSQKVGHLYDRTITTVAANHLYDTLKKSRKNLANGYPLKANIFHRFPTAITECNNLNSFMVYNSKLTNGFCGVDALVMHDILHTFKFNTTFKVFATPAYYGYAQDGHATGTLGSVVRGEIDISFNSRFVVLYLMEHSFEFLNYIWSDSLCALMKEPAAVPLWHYPFNFVNLVMWTFIISSLAVVGLLMYARSRIIIELGGNSFKLYVYLVNAVWAGLLGFFFNKRIQRSLLAATCLLNSVIVTARYQGHVNYMFATLVRYNRFSSLKEMCDNNVQVYTAPSIAVLLNRDYIAGFANKAKATLIQNLKYYPANATTVDYTLSHPDIATLERSDALLQTLIQYRDGDGKSLLYTVDECFQTYYLSYIVRTGFIFTQDLEILIMKIVEAGLPAVYYKWTRYSVAVVDRDPKPASEPRPIIKINMREQRIPFLLLLVGYVLSLATSIFGLELWCDARRRARNFNIYEYTD